FMRRRITFSFFIGFLFISLFGCGNGISDRSVPNRESPNMNNYTPPTVNANSMNSNNMTNSRASTTTGDTDFLTKAAQGGMSEVELGRLAATKAQNPDVKKFGQKMVDDHSKANSELKTLAATKNFSPPTEVNSEQKALMDKLSKLSGTDFDRAYVDA